MDQKQLDREQYGRSRKSRHQILKLVTSLQSKGSRAGEEYMQIVGEKFIPYKDTRELFKRKNSIRRKQGSGQQKRVKNNNSYKMPCRYCHTQLAKKVYLKTLANQKIQLELQETKQFFQF